MPVAATAQRFGGWRLYAVLAAGALAIGALSLLIPSTPSYDPWAWLVWGREIVHLNLQTTGGPTWKPLTVIFTTVFALFGKAQPDLWLIVGRAGAVMAVVMTFRIAWRVTSRIAALPDDARRSARIVVLLPAAMAGLIAAASLVDSRGFVSDNALGYSEGLMTALVLIAIERHLDGARRQAFAVGFAAALDRPELWVVWVPYGLYLWWQDAGARRLVAALFILIPVLWFLPEYWGSGHFFRGVTRAHHPRSNSAAFAKCPFCEEFSHHAWPTVLTRLKAAALLAMAAAAFMLWRVRDHWSRAGRPSPYVRGLAGLVLAGAAGYAWWIGVSLETQLGFSGNDRYLVLGVALVSIAGASACGWAAAAGTRALLLVGARVRGRSAAAPPDGPTETAPSSQPRPAAQVLPAAAATLILSGLFLVIPSWIGPNVIDVPRTHRALVYQADLRADVTTAVDKLGGPAAVRRCGTVLTEGFQVPMLAWTLGVHTLQVGSVPQFGPPPPPPNVIFQTRAQRSAHLLPLLSTWPGTRYRLVERVRTFKVYEHCAGRVSS